MPILIAAGLVLVVVIYLLARIRIGRIVLAGLAGLVVLGVVGRSRAMQSLEAIPVRDVTVRQAAEEVAAGAGHVRVVVVYDPTCGVCQRVVPEIARYVQRRARDGVKLYAFALTNDATDIRLMLRDDPDAFVGYKVLPYRSGELDAAMTTVNAGVGQWFAPPVVTVLAPDGMRAARWESVHDLAEMGAVVDSLVTADATIIKKH
jgi:hypothetical protein